MGAMTAHELAPALLSFLPGWVVVPPKEDQNWAELRRTSDGATVRVVVGGWRQEGRVVFRGAWPAFRDGRVYYGGKSISITCNARRAAKTLAAEFIRRFLPLFDPEHAKAIEYVQQHDTYEEEAEQVAARLARSLGGRVHEGYRGLGEGFTIIDEPEPVRRLKVRPAHDKPGEMYYNAVCVDFEVHGLDPETASQVLHIIQEAQRRPEPERTRIEALEPEELSLDEEATAGVKQRV